MRHQLGSDAGGQLCIESTLDVDSRQFRLLMHGISSQLLALPIQIGAFGIGLRTHRNIFAGSHRHGASHKTGNTRYQNAL